MKLKLSFVLVTTMLILSSSGAYSATKVSAGAKCAKAGQTTTVGKTKFTCTKSGSKLLWKVAPVPAIVVPVEPTGFENLYQNRKGVSYAAWRKAAESIKVNSSKLGKIEVRTGPSTKPHFENLEAAFSSVSKIFSASEEPSKVLIIRYKFKDLSWAENEIRNSLSSEDYDVLNRNENGRLVSSNCDVANKNCAGSKQITSPSGLAIILLGVSNDLNTGDATGSERLTTGMLEAHEYFHAIQRIPGMNKPMGGLDWPRAWIREGSAEWTQNAAVNYSDFSKYKRFLNLDCASAAGRLGSGEIEEFLSASEDGEVTGKYDQWLNYCLGAYAVETLVSIKGPQSIIDLYSQMSTRIGFEAAFRNVYAAEWKSTVAIMAKTIHSNIQGK